MPYSLTEIWKAKASDKDTDRLTVAVLKAALFVASSAESSPTSSG